jgi:hypothetical protein
VENLAAQSYAHGARCHYFPEHISNATWTLRFLRNLAEEKPPELEPERLHWPQHMLVLTASGA